MLITKLPLTSRILTGAVVAFINGNLETFEGTFERLAFVCIHTPADWRTEASITLPWEICLAITLGSPFPLLDGLLPLLVTLASLCVHDQDSNYQQQDQWSLHDDISMQLVLFSKGWSNGWPNGLYVGFWSALCYPFSALVNTLRSFSSDTYCMKLYLRSYHEVSRVLHYPNSPWACRLKCCDWSFGRSRCSILYFAISNI